MSRTKTKARTALCLLFAFLTVISGIPAFYCIWNVGIWFPAAVFFGLFAVVCFWDEIKKLLKTKGRVPMIIAAVLFVLCVIFAAVLSVIMLCSFSYGETQASTVVVLGCQVKEEGASEMLSRRLDKAYEILSENENVYCIVSGGKGENEPVTESSVMKEYLEEKGIDAGRILEENQSLNTYENLVYSKKIIQENGLDEKMLIVTDGFHQLRAKILASKQGIKTAGRSSRTPFYLAFTYWVREWFGICRAIALGY